MFDAIDKSNGWDKNTVTLQLLSHFEEDALNVALLVWHSQRATRTGLVGALNGALNDKIVHRKGEDPSKFVVEMETFAV